MLHIDLSADPSPADEALVMAGTRAHNAAFMQADAMRLCVFARDATGVIIGGVTASTYWDYLDVKFLWVHEQHRHLGLGTRVMGVAPRVRQLRTQLYDFIDLASQTCPYRRRSW